MADAGSLAQTAVRAGCTRGTRSCDGAVIPIEGDAQAVSPGGATVVVESEARVTFAESSPALTSSTTMTADQPTGAAADGASGAANNVVGGIKTAAVADRVPIIDR